MNLFFWLLWVNILLGFTNLIPMVPFDGGHMFKDMLEILMSQETRAKIEIFGSSSYVDRIISSKTSNISSLVLG